MCDKVKLYEPAIPLFESDIKHLTALLEKCKESTNKKYKCHLIMEKINEKNRILKHVKEMVEENRNLCDMYQMLDTDKK